MSRKGYPKRARVRGMNLNELAAKITKEEGGKINLSVAQVKEVIRLLAVEIFVSPIVVGQLWTLGKRHKEKK